MKNDTLVEVAKALPPVTVAGFTFLGYPLSDWAQLLAILYTSGLLFFMVKDKVIPYVKSLFKNGD